MKQVMSCKDGIMAFNAYTVLKTDLHHFIYYIKSSIGLNVKRCKVDLIIDQ